MIGFHSQPTSVKCWNWKAGRAHKYKFHFEKSKDYIFGSAASKKITGEKGKTLAL